MTKTPMLVVTLSLLFRSLTLPPTRLTTSSWCSLNLSCANKSGTHTSVKNYFWLNIKQNTVVKSAIFYKLPREVILQNCDVKYYYNTSALPSVLDGGSHLVLANMLNEKRLICSYDQGLATPLPTSSYALVSRDILCHCHLQVGLTYVLKSVVSCNISHTPVLQYTSNLAFLDHFHSLWHNSCPYMPKTLKQPLQL